MGILNLTPDSFSDGGDFINPSAAVSRAAQMIHEGADILDLGAESTRPGAKPVSAEVQLKRLIPIIQAVIKQFDVPISIDTSEPEVFGAAHQLGAQIWNDTRALSLPGAAQMAAKLGIVVVIMHRRAEDHAASDQLGYHDVTAEVVAALRKRVGELIELGVSKSNIWLDPGFGFSKDALTNFELLARLQEFKALDCPVLIGVSKKRMLGFALDHSGLASELEQRVEPGLSCAVVAALKGAKIIRTHDVAATKRALSIFNLTLEMT